MLQDPVRKWNISTFMEEGISLGWVSEILTLMEKEGYIERVSKGYLSYSLLRNPEKLIEDWIKWYRFRYNTIYNFYSSEKDIEKRLICYLKNNAIPYALTLFSAARRIAPYVKDPSIHIYIPDIHLLGDLVRFRQTLGLLEIKGSGNVSIVIPCYKTSLFKFIKSIRGIKTVSFLQLYLDLYTYSPRGKEQAEYLLNALKSMGDSLA